MLHPPRNGTLIVCHHLVRTFAVLNARRPAVAKEKEAKVERRRPEWMPPPKVFPFIWITIGILRAVSTTMVRLHEVWIMRSPPYCSVADHSR